jgi:outer membrane protein TolC
MTLPSLLFALVAAVPDAPVLTIGEVAALAAAEAPAVARAQAATEGARAREAAARAGLGPSLVLDAGFLSSNDPVDAFALALKQERFSAAEFFASDPNHPGFTHDWNGAVSAAWTADLFGAIRGEARAASAATRASARAGHRTRDAAVLQALSAFAAARRAEEALALLEERAADARRDLDIALSSAEQGLTTAADPARARAALGEVLAEVAAETSAREAALAALAALIGSEPARRPLAPLPEPCAVPDRPVAVRDDVAAAELAAAAAGEAEKAASSSRWPTLRIEGRYETHAPRPGDHWGDSASVFGGLRVPVFTSGAVNARIAQARAVSLEARALALDRRRAAEKEVASAKAAVESSAARLSAFADTEAAARTAREIQRARYEEGVARLTDLLDARGAELKARLGAAGAKAERFLAEANLRLALGMPPEGEGNP